MYKATVLLQGKRGNVCIYQQATFTGLDQWFALVFHGGGGPLGRNTGIAWWETFLMFLPSLISKLDLIKLKKWITWLSTRGWHFFGNPAGWETKSLRITWLGWDRKKWWWVMIPNLIHKYTFYINKLYAVHFNSELHSSCPVSLCSPPVCCGVTG